MAGVQQKAICLYHFRVACEKLYLTLWLIHIGAHKHIYMCFHIMRFFILDLFELEATCKRLLHKQVERLKYMGVLAKTHTKPEKASMEEGNKKSYHLLKVNKRNVPHNASTSIVTIRVMLQADEFEVVERHSVLNCLLRGEFLKPYYQMVILGCTLM